MGVTSTSIDWIGLSVRSTNALHRNGIHTVEDLLMLTDEDLLCMRNVGAKSMNEILSKIDECKAPETAERLAPSAAPEQDKKTQSAEAGMKQQSIDLIGLSIRSTNALHRYGVHTVGDMLMLTEEDLFGMRNVGRKSVDELLAKISEYKVLCDQAEKNESAAKDDQHWQTVIAYLADSNAEIYALELLSTKTFNLLLFAGYRYLYEIAELYKNGLMEIPCIDSVSCAEISDVLQLYVQDHESDILEYTKRQEQVEQLRNLTLGDLFADEGYQRKILNFVKTHDIAIADLGLSEKLRLRLLESGRTTLSDTFFLTSHHLYYLKGIDRQDVLEYKYAIKKYLDDNEAQIRAFLLSDESTVLSDMELREMILGLYESLPFGGFSLGEMNEKLSLPEEVSQARLKTLIGKLLAENELEYVDFRCYRVYGKFEDALADCPLINERTQKFILRRLHGETLAVIAEANNVTRERVRQIVSKGVSQVAKYCQLCGTEIFDEDYYQYLYENYSFDNAVAAQWFGISESTLNYFDMRNIKRGTKDISRALEDQQGLDVGLRLKIKNYLNRDKIFVDNTWVNKKRADIERLVVKKYCTENTSFDKFVQIYNSFLKQEEIEYDEDIYYTEAVLRTRKNHLSQARFLLWKLNEQIRYYEIDGRDYSELLETLNFDIYENVEFSTAKFMRDYPELMKRYDIRDQYELHNLLRKVVEDGSYHDFHCGRMPNIRFGNFDRDAAILDILIDNAPIGMYDLAELISDEYGYDPVVILASYMQSFSAYLHNGVYSIDQKEMPPENKQLLSKALTDDLYYTGEIKKIYTQLIPGADPNEVNPYNLKNMGFQVFSKYVLQNYPSVDSYFEHLLTDGDIVDISSYRKRFTYLPSFSAKTMQLKRERQVIEFEPNKFLSMRRLAARGVRREMIQTFCDNVYNFVDDGEYFSIRSIRNDGFISELDELGFPDWFYANLLAFDGRFSFGIMYGCIILFKGSKNITRADYICSLIRNHRSIDTYDLMDEMSERFGCKVDARSDILYVLSGSEIYHDEFLDRLYANKEVYYRELEDEGEF